MSSKETGGGHHEENETVVNPEARKGSSPESQKKGSSREETDKKAGSHESSHEKKPEDSAKEEAKEHGSKGTHGEQTVEELAHGHDTPHEVKEALKDPKTKKEAAAAVDNAPIFGGKVKAFAGGFLGGAAARYATKFILKRTLDLGTVGLSAAAGGVVGGLWEGVKAYRSETKRLQSIKTYENALTDFDHLTDLEKVKTVIALEASFKENVNEKKLSPTECAEYAAKLKYYKTTLEEIGAKADENTEDGDEIKHFLKYRKGAEKTKKFAPDKSPKEKTEADLKKEKETEEAVKQFGLIGTVLKKLSTVDNSELSSQQSEEVKKLLKEIQKNRLLKRDGWKIAKATIKGAVIGAAGGALGAWAFEHLSQLAVDRGYFPSHVTSGGASISPEAHHVAVSGIAAPEIVASHSPSTEDIQQMHGSVWNTVKDYMVNHGVANPTNADINSGMMEIAKANGVEISAHHLADANHAGHIAEELQKFLDTKMQPNTPLHGFDSLKEIIEKAGGHAMGTQEVLMQAPPLPDTHNLAENLIKTPEFQKALIENNTVLGTATRLATDNWKWPVAVGATAAGIGTLGYAAYRLGRGRKEKAVETPQAKKTEIHSTAPFELIGSEHEMREATLNKRLEVLNQVKAEALKIINEAGKHLEGDKPNVKQFRSEMLAVDKVLSKDQFNRLVLGANDNDSETVGQAWQGVVAEVREVFDPLHEKAKQIEASQSSEPVNVDDAEEGTDIDDEPIDETARKPETKKPKKTLRSSLNGVAAGISGFFGIEKFKEKRRNREVLSARDKALKLIELANKRLKEHGDPNIILRIRNDAQKEVNIIFRLADKMPEDDKAKALELVSVLQQALDTIEEKIKQLKEEQGGTPSPKKRGTEEHYGLEPWKAALYERAVDLKILPDLRNFSDLNEKNKTILNKFIYIMQENGSSAFSPLYGEDSASKQTELANALASFGEQNKSPLIDFFAEILAKAYKEGKLPEANKLLSEVKGLGPEILKLVKTVQNEFEQ